jgi:hypothetical protein
VPAWFIIFYKQNNADNNLKIGGNRKILFALELLSNLNNNIAIQ